MSSPSKPPLKPPTPNLIVNVLRRHELYSICEFFPCQEEALLFASTCKAMNEYHKSGQLLPFFQFSTVYYGDWTVDVWSRRLRVIEYRNGIPRIYSEYYGAENKRKLQIHTKYTIYEPENKRNTTLRFVNTVTREDCERTVCFFQGQTVDFQRKRSELTLEGVNVNRMDSIETITIGDLIIKRAHIGYFCTTKPKPMSLVAYNPKGQPVFYMKEISQGNPYLNMHQILVWMEWSNHDVLGNRYPFKTNIILVGTRELTEVNVAQFMKKFNISAVPSPPSLQELSNYVFPYPITKGFEEEDHDRTLQSNAYTASEYMIQHCQQELRTSMHRSRYDL